MNGMGTATAELGEKTFPGEVVLSWVLWLIRGWDGGVVSKGRLELYGTTQTRINSFDVYFR